MLQQEKDVKDFNYEGKLCVKNYPDELIKSSDDIKYISIPAISCISEKQKQFLFYDIK